MPRGQGWGILCLKIASGYRLCFFYRSLLWSECLCPLFPSSPGTDSCAELLIPKMMVSKGGLFGR